jgi:methylase of polypeptide subunit release factors
MKTLFEDNINTIFSPLQKGKSGVLSTNNYESVSKDFSPEILFALETAKVRFHADAVYFRRFSDKRAVIPQLYLFDYSNKRLTKEDKNRIHLQMWNGYQVPAYGIIDKSSVSIFDARETPKNKNIYAREIIKLTAKTAADTNQSFADGLFWEENANHFKFEKSAAKDLIYGIKKVYKDFQDKSGIDSHVVLKLLVQSLLIKYLEERDEKSKSGYFAGTYFKHHFQCENFCDTIRKGKLLDLLDQLAQDFNGKVFEWNKKTEKDARSAIQKTEVRQLADYLDGNNKNNQYVLWRLYSFEHLPVEVISSVYEELLTNSKDIVYTPEMIVGTLVDECMPLSNPQSGFKLIDVSCGSGIFLVKAFKRIVQWWRYEQWQKNDKLVKPSLTVLKDLLLKSIHGIDIQQDAIHLSVFSLALAVLDEVNLDSPTWEQLQFPDLSNNIVTQNFFNYITGKSGSDFDLVIGNPPFNLPKDEKTDKEPKREQYFKKLKNEIGYQSEINIPDENPALHFLVQSMKLLKPEAVLCLMMPAGPLLYQKDLRFKQALFSKYNLLQIIDFTKLADKLWGKTNVATVALFLQNSEPDKENILHLVANRTVSNQNRLFLEFDYYDFHWITKEDVLYNPHIWKANLLGGGRIVQLIERLSELPTLGNYLEQKREEGWVSGQGFTVGNKKYTADYITGMDYLAAEDLTENGVNTKCISKCQIKAFERPRNKEIYIPPHLLIRRIIGQRKIPIFLSEEYLTFSLNIIGIKAPHSSRDELYSLYDYLSKNMDICRFYIVATSGDLMIKMVTSIYSEDILSIPYQKNLNDIKLSAAETIILEDILHYELNSEVPNIFEIIASNKDIMNFSSIFCRTLNSIYQTEEKAFQLFKILDAGKYYALHFEYSSGNIQATEEKTDDLEQYISKIIPNREENQESLYIQRILKIYGQDCVLLVKPKQLRYWLPSIALRDADEVFADYIKTRYPHAER